MNNERNKTNNIELHVNVASLDSDSFSFSIYLSGTPMQNAVHADIVRLLQHAMHKFLCELDNEHFEELPAPAEF